MSKNALDRFIQSAEYEPERFYIPSSLISVNYAIDNMRGFRSGRVLEIVGAYSTGKTTLAQDLIANTQRLGKKALFVDLERTFDNGYARKCGIDLSQLDIVRADTAENALNIIETGTETYSIVVVDSLPQLLPKEELDKTYDDPSKMASAASLITRFYKRIVPLIDTHNSFLVILNQFRANISSMSHIKRKPYGPNSSDHAITWRLELNRKENAEDKTTVQLKTTKNKLGKERIIVEYDMIYGKGLDIDGDILTNAIRCGIVNQRGAWYQWNDIKVQGADKAKELFDFEQLRKEILHAME